MPGQKCVQSWFQEVKENSKQTIWYQLAQDCLAQTPFQIECESVRQYHKIQRAGYCLSSTPGDLCTDLPLPDQIVNHRKQRASLPGYRRQEVNDCLPPK
eukprot:767267-Hanusia_phi.AAC.4